MIKPETLWGLFKNCPDSQWLGDICRALGRQDVGLTFDQAQVVRLIQQDSEWLDERIEGQRERWAERQRKKRERDKDNVTECHGDNRDIGDVTDVTECHGDNRDTPNVTNKPTKPTKPTNPTKPYIYRTDTDTDIRVREDSGSGSVRVNVLTLSDEDFFNGKYSAIELVQSLCGKGFWGKAIRQLGECVVLEELHAFAAEIKAGETPKNFGATFTKRLKDRGAN
jgi:hypothetical protein